MMLVGNAWANIAKMLMEADDKCNNQSNAQKMCKNY